MNGVRKIVSDLTFLMTGYREFEKKQAIEMIDGFVKKWEEENQVRATKEHENKR